MIAPLDICTKSDVFYKNSPNHQRREVVEDKQTQMGDD